MGRYASQCKAFFTSSYHSADLTALKYAQEISLRGLYLVMGKALLFSSKVHSENKSKHSSFQSVFDSLI